MGKLLLTNNRMWLNNLRRVNQDAGFRVNKSIDRDQFQFIIYHKLNFDTDNFFQEGEDFIAASGTLIYKGLMGAEALKILLEDLRRDDIKSIRRNAIGFYGVVCKIDNRILSFVDEIGSYSLCYFVSNGQFIVTTTYYHIQECVKQEVNKNAVIEKNLVHGILDNETLFKNIYKLAGDEIIEYEIDTNECHLNHIEQNEYEVDGISFSDVVNELKDALLSCYENISNIDKTPYLFSTGGVDSRLVLAIYLSLGIKPVLCNWCNGEAELGSPPEDEEITRKIAKKFGLETRRFDVSRNIQGDIASIDKFQFERYGEYALAYGNNRKWFDIFRDNIGAYFETGNFVEILKGWYYYNDSLYKPKTTDEFIDFFPYHQLTGYSSSEKEDLSEFKEYMKKKIGIVAKKHGVDEDAWNKQDAGWLYYHSSITNETKMGNLYNMFSYSIPFFAEKRLTDIINKMPYEYKEGRKLHLALIDALCPELLEDIPFFTHIRYMYFDKESMSLREPAKEKESYIRFAKLKTSIKKKLVSNDFGKEILYLRKRYLTEEGRRNCELVDDYIKEIRKTSLLNLTKLKIDKHTYAYLNMYPYALYLGKMIDFLTEGNDKQSV